MARKTVRPPSIMGFDPAPKTISGAPPGFVLAPTPVPLPTPKYLAGIPEDATVKGLLFHVVGAGYRAADQEPPFPKKDYIPFLDYPARELAERLVEVSDALHGDLPVEFGVFNVGKHTLPVLRTSMAGRVLFEGSGDDLRQLFAQFPKAISAFQNGVEARLDVLEDGWAHIVVGRSFAFPFALLAGAAKGVIEASEWEGDVWVALRETWGCELFVRWWQY